MENWDHRADDSCVESLKCCPLCGAVNSFENVQCFVCCWHGAFEHDPELIEQGLAELIDNCPDLKRLFGPAA